RLADIEHVAVGVQHAVDAGTVRQLLDEFGDQFGALQAVDLRSTLVPVDGGQGDGSGRVDDDVLVLILGSVVQDAAIRDLSTRHSVISVSPGRRQIRCCPPSRAIIWPVIDGVSKRNRIVRPNSSREGPWPSGRLSICAWKSA